MTPALAIAIKASAKSFVRPLRVSKSSCTVGLRPVGGELRAFVLDCCKRGFDVRGKVLHGGDDGGGVHGGERCGGLGVRGALSDRVLEGGLGACYGSAGRLASALEMFDFGKGKKKERAYTAAKTPPL